MPWVSSQRITPSAAASPKADPPASTMPWTTSTLPSGPSAAASRVPGAWPRTAMAPTLPSGGSTTVQPDGPAGERPDADPEPVHSQRHGRPDPCQRYVRGTRTLMPQAIS